MQAEITPRGPFSLAAAASFGFGPTEGRAPGFDGVMRLAFALDGGTGYVGAALRQERTDRPVQVDLELREASEASALRQVARIVSLDHDGIEFLQVGERDSRIKSLQSAHHGQRPVLFHSPYEAAAWAVISARLRTARQVRAAMAAQLGEPFELAGQRLHAFPQPDRLLELQRFDGLSEVKVERLRAVARAALEGKFEILRVRALGPESYDEQLQQLPGIGPFYAGLIVLRACGLTDATLLAPEPKVFGHIVRLYGLRQPPTLEEFTVIAEAWRPFRTWTTVLIRIAGERGTF